MLQCLMLINQLQLTHVNSKSLKQAAVASALRPDADAGESTDFNEHERQPWQQWSLRNF